METLSVATRDGGAVTLDDDAIRSAFAGFGGRLVTARDADYSAVSGIWNGMIVPSPALIAQCRGVADVRTALAVAEQHSLRVAVRSGGHNVAGLASCDGGLTIDLSLMRAVRVDPNTGSVRVEGGARLGDIDRETQAFGLAVPFGVVSETGVAGLTLGGGTGWQMRKRGLTIDNLLSADVVTSSGEVLVASEQENPDLFWGLRGGGGGLGVVTSFEYQAHPVGPLVATVSPFYALDVAHDVTRAFCRFMSDAPEEIAGALVFGTVRDHPVFPAEHVGKKGVQVTLIYTGDDLEAGARLMEPMRHVAQPLFDFSGPIPWTVQQSLYDQFLPDDQRYYWKSLYLNEPDDAIVDHVVQLAASIPSPLTQMTFQPMGGAVARVGAQDTAFGPRDMPYMLGLESIWKDSVDDDMNVEWTRRSWTDSQPHSTGGLYINVAGSAEENTDLMRAAIGSENFEKLVALRLAYDPSHMFAARGSKSVAA